MGRDAEKMNSANPGNAARWFGFGRSAKKPAEDIESFHIPMYTISLM